MDRDPRSEVFQLFKLLPIVAIIGEGLHQSVQVVVLFASLVPFGIADQLLDQTLVDVIFGSGTAFFGLGGLPLRLRIQVKSVEQIHLKL